MSATIKIIAKGELRGEFEINRQVTTFGRSERNHVPISLRGVAAVHATLLQDENGYVLIDHSTRSGTFVDGVRVDKKRLASGSRIRLGKHAELLFEISRRRAADGKAEEWAIEKRPGRAPISDIHKSITLEEAGFHYDTNLPDALSKKQIHERHLSTIYQVNQAITEVFGLDELARRVLDLIFRLFPVDRAAVILCDNETRTPYPFIVKTTEGSPESNELGISQTVLKKAITEKTAVMAVDTYFDERFRNVSSIMRKHIRSVMCVPLHTKGKILGALYVDSVKTTGVFLDDDLRLFFAIGGALANAIENTWLVEKAKSDERRLSTLERYLPSAVVEHVVGRQDLLELGGKQLPVSVIFADIRNFTSLAEQIGPEDVVSLLNEYFSSMADVVFEFEGTLGEYIGDEIMAYFGAPLECADHASRAIAVALKMKEEIRSLRRQWKAKGSSVFSIGIGIATGPAIAGNIGSAKQMKYTVIGDTVNLAARLCSHAKPGQILISPETHRAAGEASKATPFGTAALKGISRPVELYEIVPPRD